MRMRRTKKASRHSADERQKPSIVDDKSITLAAPVIQQSHTHLRRRHSAGRLILYPNTNARSFGTYKAPKSVCTFTSVSSQSNRGTSPWWHPAIGVLTISSCVAFARAAPARKRISSPRMAAKRICSARLPIVYRWWWVPFLLLRFVA